MIGLLEMCGFDRDEANSQLPRMQRTFDKLGITPADIEHSKRRLEKYYDMELEGIRKIFRLCMLETTNSVLAREEGKEKIVFGFMAPGLDVIGTAMMSESGNVIFAHQCWAIMAVLGFVFDKFLPVLEAAEKQWLKSGAVGHCANVKSLLGLFALDILPKPDLLLTAGFSCETAPKTIDLLHETNGIPVCCVDTCQDRAFADFSESSRRTVDLAAKSLKHAVERIGGAVGFAITDDMIFEALAAKGALMRVLQKVFNIIETSDPLVLSATHHALFMTLAALTFSKEKLPEAVDAAETLYKELKGRVEKGQGVVPKGAPRVLGILPCHHTDPRLEHMLEEMGMAFAAIDIDFGFPYPDKPDDPYEIMSLHLLQSLGAILSVRCHLIVEGCKRLNIDGVLNRYHVGCRAVAGDPMMIADSVSKTLGIPALTLEWENFDPRVFDRESFQKRLELFKMVMKKGK